MTVRDEAAYTRPCVNSNPSIQYGSIPCIQYCIPYKVCSLTVPTIPMCTSPYTEVLWSKVYRPICFVSFLIWNSCPLMECNDTTHLIGGINWYIQWVTPDVEYTVLCFAVHMLTLTSA